MESKHYGRLATMAARRAGQRPEQVEFEGYNHLAFLNR